MLGHLVHATLWHVVVQFRTDDLQSAETKTYTQRHLNVLTATDDGADVYEVARRDCFSDMGDAARHEFGLVQVQRVCLASGMAIGHVEQRGQA